MANDSDSKSTSGAGGFTSSAQRGGVTVEECQNMIQRSLRTPMVKFLKEQLEKSGCSIRSNFIKAANCDAAAAGGYSRGGGIVVCSNHVELQDEVTQVVIHELIHAYDECRAANMEWSDCAHHACSEIRAGHLSGDCHYKRELLRGFLKIRVLGTESHDRKDKLVDYTNRSETTNEAIKQQLQRRQQQGSGGGARRRRCFDKRKTS